MDIRNFFQKKEPKKSGKSKPAGGTNAKRRKVVQEEKKSDSPIKRIVFSKKYPIGYKFVKTFDDGDYVGQVKKYEEAETDDGSIAMHYTVWYEQDGDKEQLSEEEVSQWPAYEEKKEESRSGGGDSRSTTKRKAAPAKQADGNDGDSDLDTKPKAKARKSVPSDEDLDMDEEPKTRVASSKRSTASARGKRKKADSLDDDDYESDEAPSSDDEELELESKVEGVSTKKKNAPKKKGPVQKKPAAKKRKEPAKKKAPAAAKAPWSSAKLQEELQAKLAKDRKTVKPNNNPQKVPDQGYVDPVGVDPTHGIVESVIAGQVRKVGGLLQRVAQRSATGEEMPLGELSFPIRLQTACSGTDAPSIALGLIKESLDKMYASRHDNDNVEAHGFDYSHKMSCELEPFKRSYLGRNFPDVTLFPDITKLTASEEVVDVYGRPQRIPDGNLFVAGTSCKDFSMLKTRDRKDIEDKGTSGETFLAAVEFLEEQKPPVAIFENVDNAPWAKMQEYITGRIRLADRNNTKAIKDSTKKADADNELKFSVTEEGEYVAEEVPRQVGIRAGSIVEGVVRAGHGATDVEPLNAKGLKAHGLVTLKELATRHDIDLEGDTLVLVKKARYCTRLVKLDTKNYGLPQTRQRKYLYIWRSDDPNDDTGDYFNEILELLKTPLLYSMDAFLLPDSHDRIRCFREALRSGPGLMVKRERAKELDFFDWEKSHVKDLTLHLVFREKNGIAERSRVLTQWNTRGRKMLAPGLWPELFDCWNMRRLDMIDCFAAAATRDAISRDPLHHSFTWDLSQNVTRAPFRSATVGVCGCVTPGGELLLPRKGRSLMGFEKLLLQGIPFSRLVLGPQSEVQLSDLAGNAMSVSVVCATMLAAICAPELKRQRHANPLLSLKQFALGDKHDAAGGKVLAERGDLFEADRDANEKSLADVFRGVASELAFEGFQTSVLCNCESSGTTSNDNIVECADCGMSICHSCFSRHQTDSHRLKEVETSGDIGRPDSHEFERKLRCEVPSLLRLSEGWEECLEHGDGLEAYSFNLQQVSRKEGHWEIAYGAWEDNGNGRQVAEIRINIGRTGTLDTEMGIIATIRCFAPAIRHKNPLRGKLKDSARLVLKARDEAKCSPAWQVPAPSTKCTLRIVGSDACASQRVLVGLNDKASSALKAHKVQKSFLPKFRSRNSLTQYPAAWKTWPGTVVISGDTSDRVNGTYRKLKCLHTTVHSALWRRDEIEGKPCTYIYIRPDVVRAGLDVAVVSLTPSYHDSNMELCELHDWIPENALQESTHDTKTTFLEWKACPESLRVELPTPSMVVESDESFHETFCAGTEDSSNSDLPVLCKMMGLSREVVQSLVGYDQTGDEGDVTKIDLFGRLGSRNAKRLSIIAAPALLKHAAEGKLPLSLGKWYKLPSSLDIGQREIHVPSRPVEEWRQVPSGVERAYDAEESNDYYQRLLRRPRPFQVDVVKSQGALELRMDPSVAIHNACARLGGERHGTIEVSYRLAELSSMGEPDTKEFRVPNSDAHSETVVDGLLLPLYHRQAKALTRMLAIEAGAVHFSEEERSEHTLPGIGWCLVGRAAKKSPLRGGVLGDAIGSGKTVITIALILAGVAHARQNRNVSEGRSGATLIVVPPGLVRQWDDERIKFTGDRLRSIVIDSTATLKNTTVEDICSADIVIVPAGILEEENGQRRPYTELLSHKSGSGRIPRAPTYYSQREAPTIEGTWVRNMSSGPEIYVGNKGTQQNRDLQAYYGHCYSEAITKLREKTFVSSDKGVPLEYFTWERVVIDECHETLVTGKRQETKDTGFKEKARRGAREFLGVSQTDIEKRPLVAAAGVWGLTGTPLLETEARVTELANLMGGTYLCGAASHWRKEERESGRDLFLNQQEDARSRDYRCAVQDACHSYVREACQRNRGEKLQVELNKVQHEVNMSANEGEAFMKQIADLQLESFAVGLNQLGDKVGPVLEVTASSKARQTALLEVIASVQESEPDTKIVVFANAGFGGYGSALEALKESGTPFCSLSDGSSVYEQNEIISWFRHVDATEEDRARPRILLLAFEQAAGHNLQEACHNVIIYDPMYSGTDAVADASVEEQAVGRVMRQGQNCDVTVTRIVVKGPNGERCLDDSIVERNLDESVLSAATSNFD